MKYWILLVSFLFSFNISNAVSLSNNISDSVSTKEDISAELSSVFNYAKEKNLKSKPINDVIIEVGKYFFDIPYVIKSLEKDGEEKLVLKLNGFDCTTFVENVLAIARIIKKGNLSQTDFEKELTLIRYRNGKINRYPSRLHYFSDWIYDNGKKNIVSDVTKTIGGKPIKFALHFMSKHSLSYSEKEFVPILKSQEDEIKKREYYYIPKENINQISDKLKSGDIIAFTSTIQGLDISHTAIVVKDSLNIAHILHASSKYAKVLISDETLFEFAAQIRKVNGIIVSRPVEP